MKILVKKAQSYSLLRGLHWSFITALSVGMLSGCSTPIDEQQTLDKKLEAYNAISSPTAEQELAMKTLLAESPHRSGWATVNLAYLYDQPSASQQEKAQILALYDQAFEQGYYSNETVAYVASQHLKGRLPNADQVKGYNYLRFAANLNNEWAQFKVVDLLVQGNAEINLPSVPKSATYYIPRDNVDFQAWHCLATYSYRLTKKCVVDIMLPNANQQTPHALLGLALAYEKGWHVEQSEIKAADYYRQAVELGMAKSELFFADLLLASKDPQQQQKGVALLEERVLSNFELAPAARVRLAAYYFSHQRYKEALKHALNQTQRDDKSAEMEYQLYQHYAKGLATAVDKEKADKYLRLAMLGKLPQAMFDFFSQANTAPDEQAYFIGMAAMKNNLDAILWMVEQALKEGNQEKYQIWLKEAAIAGHTSSQLQLAMIYEKQFSDLAYAAKWYQKAAKSGDKSAKKWLSQHSNNSFTLPPGKLLIDGSFILPNGYSLIPQDNNDYLQANIEQVWPSHCGWVVQRATGEATVVINQNRYYCDPSDQELDLLQQEGVVKVVSNGGSTAAILKNGQLISWGTNQMGGYLIEETQWIEDQEKPWSEYLALYHAMEQDVVDVKALQSGFVALTKSGDVWQWGLGGKAYKIEGKYRQLLGGYRGRDVCGITRDGSLNCWIEPNPEIIITVVKGVKSALSTPFQNGGDGFGLIVLRDGEFDGVLSSWYVYQGGFFEDHELQSNQEIMPFDWRDLCLDKGDHILATREDGAVMRIYYPGVSFMSNFMLQSSSNSVSYCQ
ncbi:tetratricopeptide repeat protein [Vibrio sp. N418]|uniref:tetratricopeptide repeat protein n=1 Tax=Vibrio sp. (strain N418) TaxID=701176 RepID=UPI0002E1C783|nr:SEL1-like repeat protein [Vibrio sp. N418]